MNSTTVGCLAPMYEHKVHRHIASTVCIRLLVHSKVPRRQEFAEFHVLIEHHLSLLFEQVAKLHALL